MVHEQCDALIVVGSKRMTIDIGYVHTGYVPEAFCRDLARATADLAGRGLAGGLHVTASARINEARTDVIEAFLAGPNNWLLMVDTDMTFEADAIYQLWATALAHSLKVVGGLCFLWTGSMPLPTLYYRTEDGGHEIQAIYEKDTPLEVDATGAAFILIHREVFETVRDDHEYPWYRERRMPNGVLGGPDISFCWAIREAGYQIYVAGRVKIGHIKSMIVNENAFDRTIGMAVAKAQAEASEV